LLAASGALLFVPSADRYASSPVFLLKLGAMAGGGINALAFHLATRQGVGGWEQRSRHPAWNVRTAAVVSILLWLTVIALGRWMGYERRDPPPADIELPLFDAAPPTELRE
jgi:hypothetical protein